MPGRKGELAILGVLVAASAGALYLLWGFLDRPGVASEAQESPPRRPPPREAPRSPEPPPRESRAPQEPPEPPEPEEAEEPEPAEEVPAEAREPGPPEGAVFAPAVLQLELLTPAEEPDRRIEVRVVDQAGFPVPDALAVFRKGALLLYRERTDMGGVALFQPYESEEGPFRVDVLARGFYTGTAPAVAAGATTEIILQAKSVVEGRVEGASFRKGVVTLTVGDERYESKLGEDGGFLFEDLDAGEAWVQVEVPDYGSDAQELFLAAGTRRFVRLRLGDRHRVNLSGEIRGWPGSGKAWINGTPVQVNPTGSFRFEGAITGPVELLVDAPGKALLRHRFTVRTRAHSRVKVRLKREGKVRGIVTSADRGTRLTSVVVYTGVNRDDPRNDRVPLFPVHLVPTVRTDEDGRFEITRLDQRLLYLVTADAPGHAKAVFEAVPMGGTLEVRLPARPFLYGRVRGVGGVPRDVVVTARPLGEQPKRVEFNDPDWDEARSGRDEKGFYGLSGLVPDLYLLRAEAPGFAPVEAVLDLNDIGRRRFDFLLRRGSGVDPEEAELLQRLPPVVDFEEGALRPEEQTFLEVDLTRPADRAPFPSIRVEFFEGDREIAPPRQYSGPVVEVVGLPEATYRAILIHPSLKKPRIHDRFELRRTEPVKIVMR